jgi:ubiquinone/menaquinone biosynthesis C-methylase UbiE
MEGEMPASGVRRLHWGCGPVTAPGWINSDLWELPGVELRADILEGLPLEDNSIDYAFSNHALQELELYDQETAFAELRRVLKPNGVLRLCLPDFDLAIDAYRRRDHDFFFVDEWETLAGKFITQVIWHGYNRTPFTYEFADELARKAGFRDVRRAEYRETASRYPEIVELDTRADESFYLEAWK